jgi:hypothetical protein
VRVDEGLRMETLGRGEAMVDMLVQMARWPGGEAVGGPERGEAT